MDPSPRPGRPPQPPHTASGVPHASAPPPPAIAAPPGRVPAEYRVIRRLGVGRYGTVELCRVPGDRTEVAVKLLPVRITTPRGQLALHAELLAVAAAAKHPCAVTVREVGFVDEMPYLTNEFCPVGSAHARLATTGPLPWDDVAAIGVRLALALHSAHRRGVLHLDVRPANILFDADDAALLADHGLTRALRSTAPELGVHFDPLYAPRELFGWEPPGPPADVHGLGATLYALLTGAPPHADQALVGPSAHYQAVMTATAPPPVGVPPPLAGLLQRMTSAHPGDRPPLTEVHRVLHALLPSGQLARVPDLLPEPEPELPLPGWDKADDALIDELADAPDAPSDSETRRHRKRVRLVTATAATLLAGGIAAALLLPTEDDSTPPEPPPPPSQSPSSMKVVPADQLPLLQARQIRITAVADQFHISWGPPQQPVTGYLITARSPSGAQVDKPQSTAADERRVVFTSPPVQPDTCYIVTSLVRATDGTIQLAPSPPACR